MREVHLCLPQFYIIIFVSGLLENSLVLAVICGKKEPKSVNEMFIVNLTISDITFLAFESPVNVYIYFVPRYASISICKVVFPMLTATFIVSVATVTSMAIQRCYAILNPLKPRMKRLKKLGRVAGCYMDFVISISYSTNHRNVTTGHLF